MTWYERTGRWLEAHRFVVDLTTTVLLGAFLATSATDLYETGAYGGSRADVIAWSLATAAPLPWRRVRPVASAVAIYAVALGHMVVGFPMVMPSDLLVLVALFSVTVYGPTWAHVTAISSAATGCLVAFPIAAGLAVGDTASIVHMVPVGLFCLVTALAVWAFALTRRSRRVTLEVLRDRAHRLEIERDQQAQIAASAERARIAREMHDIVAHSLSIVVAQADGGRYVAASDPAAAARVLGTISETGRTALTEMRRLLGVLREDDDPAARPELSAPRSPAPQPGVEELDDLVDQARGAGLRVAYTRLGEPRPLTAGMGLTLYRVCQESLSNVRKHAGPDPAVTVALHWTPDEVELEVLDDGRGAAAAEESEPGFGLRGMHERASLYGGTLTSGPRSGGGYRVHLALPLPGSAPVPGGHDAGGTGSPDIPDSPDLETA
ncbi:sensor histidine kinase [Isoptericola sp. BMS4]|uniref:sensor histidine kinase n=1 Tax=Isoptericola sp. BMS4 TaxID=2527875 RepID=UPI0014221866|nr:histidine kinase [Isoptericola sp. BMS4]